MGLGNPTTKAQVTGHRFLKRRVEHGLVLGDTRLIYDPLQRRRRALGFGAAAAALVAVGAGAMALFSPQPDPGDASILRAESGQLFVVASDGYHPVANLSSARLVSGSSEQPKKVADSVLKEMPKGVPIGIVDAPGILEGKKAPELHFAACAGEEVIFIAGSEDKVQLLTDGAAVVATSAEGEYLLSAHGRMLLPPEDTSFGRILRRGLGITADTPQLRLPSDVLSAMTELPVAAGLEGASAWVSTSGTGEQKYWAHFEDGIVALTELQFEILSDTGVPVEHRSLEEVAQAPDSARSVALPAEVPEIQSLEQVCVNNAGEVGTWEGSELLGVDLRTGARPSAASRYLGPGYGFAVDTGAGQHVLSETGIRHELRDVEPSALGLERSHSVNWLLLRLLPVGSELSKEAAMRPFT